MKKSTKITLTIAIAAMMIALQFVFERKLSIPISDSFRISTTFIPRAITGICLSIVLCGLCSGAADAIGSMIFYASINPLISLSAILRGVAFGFLYRNRKPGIVKTVMIAFIDQMICGGIVTTLGLILFGSSPNSAKFWGLRFTQSGILFLIEIPVLLACNKYVYPRVKAFLETKGFFDSEK